MNPPPTETKPDLATLYTPGQLDVLRDLQQIQAEAGLSDGKFAAQHLTISASTWSRIQGGVYAADAATAFTTLAGNLRVIRIERARGAKLTGGTAFHEIEPHKAVINAIVSARLKAATDPERLVVFLAPSGGGKTRLGREITVMFGGYYVEATESWRDSYFSALCAIGRSVGVNESELLAGRELAEQKVINRFKARRTVLVIDEGEYFGPRTMNLLKMLLNQTETVIVLLAIPALFERWQKKSWEESRQLNRRCEAIVEAGPVIPSDVAQFASKRLTISGPADKVWGVIAKAANEFGHYSMVRRVIEELARDGESVSLAAAENAVRIVKKLLNRSGEKGAA